MTRRKRSKGRSPIRRFGLALTAKQLAKLDGLARRHHVNRSLLAGMLVDSLDASWAPPPPPPPKVDKRQRRLPGVR